MASPRANWFVDELDEALAADPFEAPIEEIGAPIDLRAEPDLIVRLAELVGEEGDLDRDGVTCTLRMRPSMVCSACPVSQAADRTPHGALCRNGIEQELVLATIAVVEDRDARTP